MPQFVYWIRKMDEDLFLLIFHKWFQSAYWYWILRSVSCSADGYLFLLVACLSYYIGISYFLAIGVVAVVIEKILYYILKYILKRTRPCNKIGLGTSRITPSDEFSCPSGHAGNSIILALLTISFFPIFVSILFVGWALLVGLSRIHLGVHYPLDIIAGWVIGCFAFMLSSYIVH